MSKTIEIKVGDLYAQIHEEYAESQATEYDEQLRSLTENFIHKFNQQVEREQEQLFAETAVDDLQDE